MRVNETWTAYHNAGVAVLTTAPADPDVDGEANVGAPLIVAFLVAVALVVLGKALAPAAQLVKTLVGVGGAVLLTLAAFALVVVLTVH